MSNSPEKIQWSFVSLMAVMMSFVALSIDSMLPALGEIGRDLSVKNPNDVQMVISSVFFGMGFGMIFFGPFSDSFGRKPGIFIGMGIFFVGCVASIVAESFEVMIVGRILQGMGAASSRIITVAMIRDRYSGNAMGKVMSLILILFILVPALAPSVGQGIMLFADWRAIFVMMLGLCVLSVTWFSFGQRETLGKDQRLPFRFKTIWNGVMETVRHPVSRGYTLSSGFVFGAFVGYLSSSHQILQEQYELGKMFAIVFGALALAIGISSYFNAKWVDRIGMEELCLRALKAMVALAVLFLPLAFYFSGHPPLWLLLTYLTLTFFCAGQLFANFTTLAIQPLGHIAGVANSVISALQTVMASVFGGIVSYNYDGTVNPLAIGFLFFGSVSLFLIVRMKKHSVGE